MGEAVAIYPWHDLHMLVFAASMDGQGAIAVQAGRDYSRIAKNPIYILLTQIRFGRFEDILEDMKTRTPGALSGPVWEFAQGYAHAPGGQPRSREDTSRARAGALRTRRRRSSARIPRRNSSACLPASSKERSRSATGDQAAALAAFQRAVSVEDSLVWDEPEPLPFSARHWLGAALLETGRPADAEPVYRADLKKHPHNGWSLLGLSQALAAQEKPAREATEEFERSWVRSDTWIRASRF